jgi:hypothetical protein
MYTYGNVTFFLQQGSEKAFLSTLETKKGNWSTFQRSQCLSGIIKGAFCLCRSWNPVLMNRLRSPSVISLRRLKPRRRRCCMQLDFTESMNLRSSRLLADARHFSACRHWARSDISQFPFLPPKSTKGLRCKKVTFQVDANVISFPTR